MPNEKLYLVCKGCGEAFDAIEPAKEHEAGSFGCEAADGYDILPESEAF